MKQFHWLLCITRNCDWSRKITPLSNLTQSNLTVKLDSLLVEIMKTYSKSRIELRNLQMLKKMLENSTQFLSWERPCGAKSLNVSLNIAGVEIMCWETCGYSQHWRSFDSSFEWKEVFRRWKFVSSVVSDSQISLTWYPRHLMAAIQLATSCSELYFSRCCALKRTGTFVLESKVTCLF